MVSKVEWEGGAPHTRFIKKKVQINSGTGGGGKDNFRGRRFEMRQQKNWGGDWGNFGSGGVWERKTTLWSRRKGRPRWHGEEVI